MSRRIHTGGSSRGLSGRDGHDAGWLADGGVSDSSASAQWGGYVSSASGSSRPRLRRRGSVDGTSGGGGGGRRRGGGGEAAAVAVDSSSEDMDARYVRARDVSAAAAVNVYGGGGAPLRRRSTSRGRTARRGRGRSRDGPSRGRGCSREDSGGDGGDGSGGGGNSSTSLAAAAAAAAVAAEAATRPLNRLPMGSSSARRRREAAAAVAAADATTAAMGEGNTSGWVPSPLAPVMPDDWTLDSSVSATSGSSRRRRGGLRRELGEPPSASSTTTTAAAGDHGAWVDPAWVTFSRPPRGGRGRRRRRRVADDPTASGGLPYYSRSGGSFGGGGGGWGSRSGRGGMLGALVSRLSLLRRGFGGGGNGGGEGHGHLPSASLARMAVLVLGFFVFYLAWTAGAGERGAPPAAETGRSGSIDGGDLAAVPAMPAKLSFGGAALDFVRRWITTASSVVTGGDESDGGGGGALGGDDVGTPAGPDAATDAVAAGKPASPPADGQLTDLQKAAAVVLTVKEDPDDAEAPLAAQRLRPPSASMPLPPAVSVSPSADLPASTPPSPPPSPPPSASPSTSASPSPSEAPSEAPLETPSVVATATAAGAPSPATKEQGDRAHTGGAGEAAAAPTSTGGGGGESAPADRVSGEGRDGVGAAAPAVADGPPPSTAGSGQENGPATTRGNDSGGVGDSVASAATPGNGTDGMVSATAPAAAAPSSLMPLNNLLRWDMDAVENPTLGRHVVGLGTKHDHIVVHKPLCVDPATEKLHFLDTGARCSGFNQTAVWLQQYCPMMQESCIKEALLPLGDRMPASWLAEAEAAGNVDWVEAPTVVQFMEKNCGNIAHYAGRALMLEHVVANSVAYIGTTAPRGIENVLLVPSLHVMKRFTLPHNYGYWHKSLLAALVGPARLRLSTLDRFVAHARKPYVGKLRVHLVNNLTRAARVGDPSAGAEGGPARLVCFRTAVTPSFLKARFFVDDSEYPSALPSIPLVPVEGAPAVPRDAVRVRSRVHALLHPKEPGVAVNWGLPTPPPVAKRVVFIDRYGSRRALGASDKERLTGLLSELAASKGFTFEKVTFDNMTFDEQVTTMSTAAMAVGIHGANLVNSAFMPANAVLVELFPYQFTHDMYVEGGHAGVRYFAHHMLTGTDFPGLARYRTAARCIVRSHDCKVHYRDSQLTITDADLTALTATFTSAFKFLHLVAKHRSALKAAGGGGSGGDGRDGGGGGTEASRDGGGGGGAITSGDRPHGPDDLVPATAGDPPEQHGF
ncbi:hypothetical protein MMPV_006283 [Pyropia vietnamensis]